MNRSSTSGAPMGVGVVSILTVLLVLTLSLFAALTLSSARSDLALSQINAQTVQAYYQADSQAAALYLDFSQGSEQLLDQLIPIREDQALHIRFVRDPSGAPSIALWETVPLTPQTQEENHWNLWGGAES